MRPSSSVFDGVLARGGVAEQVSGRAWLQALLDFEAALARAQARAGIISDADADAIAAVCDADRYDVAEIGAGAAEIGNPAGAVVKALKAATDAPGPPRRDEPGRRRHGDDARRQARAGAAARRPARRGRRRGARSRKTHRDTPIMGRTLLQDGAADDVRAQGRGLDGRRSTRPPTTCTTCGSPISSAARSGRSSRSSSTSASTRRCSPGTRCAAASASSPARSAWPAARSARPRATSR